MGMFWLLCHVKADVVCTMSTRLVAGSTAIFRSSTIVPGFLWKGDSLHRRDIERAGRDIRRIRLNVASNFIGCPDQLIPRFVTDANRGCANC